MTSHRTRPAKPRRITMATLMHLAARLILCSTTLAAADPPGPKRVAETTFSVASGFFDGPIQIAISTPAPDATIRFTTNGAVPSTHSGTTYSGPLTLTTTTILRAAAFKDGLEPSTPDTRTFLFPRDVAHQGVSPAGFPTTWGIREGQPVPADYEMDPDIVNAPAYRGEIVAALKSLPSVSLVLDPHDLFDPHSGIYSNPRESGPDWERPAAVEYLDPRSARGFRIDAGLRVQGGWNRRPEESPKHAFRVVFRKRHGAGRLRFPLFGESGVHDFDEVILRAGCNNSWLHWSGEERRRGDYIRDQWMRDSLAAMGHPSARGHFVHLYLNGLYWGVYNLVERPAGPFVAGNFGGAPHDFDVRNGSNLLEGDGQAWDQLVRSLESTTSTRTLPAGIGSQLNLTQFADYILLNLYGSNGDWDGSSNWYAARRRNPPGPFRFFVWDGERTLENPEDNTLDYDAADSPPRLFQRLRTIPEFRRLFAGRARLHLTGNGALTPQAAANRYEHWSRQLDPAMVAESARWGDYRRDAHPYKTGPFELYTREEHWRPEIRRLLTDYFPRRTSVVLRQFEAAGLMPEPGQ